MSQFEIKDANDIKVALHALERNQFFRMGQLLDWNAIAQHFDLHPQIRIVADDSDDEDENEVALIWDLYRYEWI